MSVGVCDLSELCVTSNDPSRSKNIRERANQELFCENFQNDSTDKFSRLEKRVKNITEDNGVRIESPFEKEGLGLTVREYYEKEQEALKNCPRFAKEESNIFVLFHYSAYLKDEIEDSPFDHSYSTGLKILTLHWCTAIRPSSKISYFVLHRYKAKLRRFRFALLPFIRIACAPNANQIKKININIVYRSK